MKQRIYSLDIIRILATFAILLFHWNIYAVHYGIETSPVLPIPCATGTIAVPAVSLFFILSGASLMLSSRRAFTLSGYFKRRFLSIYPLYWLSYAVVFFLVYVFRRVPMNKPLATLPLSFLAMDGLLADIFNTWYLVGEWFVGCIVLLYLLFPLLRLAVRRAPGLSLLCAVLFALFLPKIYALPLDITHFPLTRAPEMVLGMVYAEVFFPDGRSRAPSVRVLGSFFGITANVPIPHSAKDTNKPSGQIAAAFIPPSAHEPASGSFQESKRAVFASRRLLLAAGALAVGLYPFFLECRLPETILPLLWGFGLFVGLELLLSLLLPKGRKLPALSFASGMTYSIFLVHHIFVGEFLGRYLGGSLPHGTNLLLFGGYLVFVTVLGTALTLLIGKIVKALRHR